jgi:hypothetical protein
MKVRINWAELIPALWGLVVQIVVLAVLAVFMRGTTEEFLLVVGLCAAVIVAQAVFHLGIAYAKAARITGVAATHTVRHSLPPRA